MSKYNYEKNLEKLSDDESLYDEFEYESDRGHALLAASALDVRLRNLIENFLIDDKCVEELLERQLKEFRTRTEFAYCLGMITKPQHDNLDRISQIRNHFAHNLHGSSFEDEPVKDWCLSLTLDDEDPDFDNIPRNRYTSAYTELALDFQYYIASVQSRRCIVRAKTWLKSGRDYLNANTQQGEHS